MVQDLNFIVLWWFFLGLFGVSSLPFTVRYFSKFWDLGYIFSKTIGWLFVSYLVFTLSVFKILPFGVQSIWLILVLWASYNWLYVYKKNQTILQDIKKHIKSFLVLELSFFLILAIWSYVRGFQPDIEGLEKYMDWGFVNTILRTTYFPPVDMWYAGEPINYYYFGHLAFALLTKITGINSAITYNLSIATCAAFAFSSALSISSNLLLQITKQKRKLISLSLVSAILLTFGGNFQPIYKIAKLYSENKNLIQSINTYWYPDATRFIGFDPDTNDKTIHEFPAYSFIVSDLHGHVNDIPVVLLLIAIILNTVLGHNSSKKTKIIDWELVLPYGFLLSIAYMTNAWDFAIYGLLFAITYTSVFSLSKVYLNGILIVGLKYIFNIPFSINFIPMVEGIKFSETRSPFYQLSILYGGFWVALLPLFILILFTFLKKTKFKIQASDLFFLGLFITATILIIIPEIIYLKDIYTYEHRRANTMFKLTYQSYIMYSLVFSYAFLRFSSYIKTKLVIFYRLLVVLIFVVHAMYQYFSIKGYYGIWYEYNGSVKIKEYKGLLGSNFIRKKYPEYADAISWLNKLPGQPNILEANGDSYANKELNQTLNHTSMATGLPTIVGWLVHEWLWRGGYDAPAHRASEVSTIYESEKPETVSQTIQKYNIKYIIVGSQEVAKYKSLNTKNFEKLNYPIVFSSGDLKIYEVR